MKHPCQAFSRMCLWMGLQVYILLSCLIEICWLQQLRSQLMLKNSSDADSTAQLWKVYICIELNGITLIRGSCFKFSSVACWIIVWWLFCLFQPLFCLDPALEGLYSSCSVWFCWSHSCMIYQRAISLSFSRNVPSTISSVLSWFVQHSNANITPFLLLPAVGGHLHHETSWPMNSLLCHQCQEKSPQLHQILSCFQWPVHHTMFTSTVAAANTWLVPIVNIQEAPGACISCSIRQHLGLPLTRTIFTWIDDMVKSSSCLPHHAPGKCDGSQQVASLLQG
jgi:hypothetical protein